MNKILIVVDMQNDFITGSLGNTDAQSVVPNVVNKITEYIPLVKDGKAQIFYTLDTHSHDYLETQEGKNLPVVHCQKGTDGWNLNAEVEKTLSGIGIEVIKESFGSIKLAENLTKIHKNQTVDGIEIVGLVSSICVISNALIIKAALPEVEISVCADCTAGITKEDNDAAFTVMKCCQINVK